MFVKPNKEKCVKVTTIRERVGNPPVIISSCRNYYDFEGTFEFEESAVGYHGQGS